MMKITENLINTVKHNIEFPEPCDIEPTVVHLMRYSLDKILHPVVGSIKSAYGSERARPVPLENVETKITEAFHKTDQLKKVDTFLAKKSVRFTLSKLNMDLQVPIFRQISLLHPPVERLITLS